MKRHSAGRVNIKVVIILVSVVVVLGAGAFVARHVRREYLSGLSLTAGNAAYDRQDWPAACEHFVEYMHRKPDNPEVLRKYAKALTSVEPMGPGGIGKVLWTYRRLLRIAPEDAEVYERLAELYLYTEDMRELSFVAERKLEQDPQSVKAPLWQAQCLMATDSTDEARKMLESLTHRLEDMPEKHPEYVEACRLLSVIARQSKPAQTPAEALKWLNRAVTYNPKSAKALIHRAVFYRTSRPVGGQSPEGMLQAARDNLQWAEEARSDDPRIALTLSQEWMHHGQLDRADRWLRSVRQVDRAIVKKYFIEVDGWVILRFRQAIELAIKRNKPVEAEAEAREVLDRLTIPDRRLSVLPMVIKLYLTSGRAKEARQHLDEYLNLLKVLQIKGFDEDSALLQAMVASIEGRPERVIDHLKPLMAGDNPPLAALRLLARTYDRLGHRLSATRTLERYLKLPEGAEDLNMWLLLALQHRKGQDWSKAIQAATKAEELDGKNLRGTLIRIDVEIQAAAQGAVQDKKSLADLSGELVKLQQAHPTNVRIVSLQALVELARGRPEVAEQQLKRAIRASGKSLELELLLVSVLTNQGRTKEALKLAGDACDHHGRSPRPWKALSALHQTAGDYPEAQAAIQRGLKTVGPNDRQGMARSLAVMELLRGDRKRGLKRLGDLAKQDFRDVTSRGLLLTLPEVIKDTELAERLLEEIGQARGKNSSLWWQHRARLWMAGDQWRTRRVDIIRELKEWRFQDPTGSLPALTLAGVHLRLGEAEQAELVCRRTLTLNPSATEVAEFMVALLRRQERHAEAAAVLRALKAPVRRKADLRLRTGIVEGDIESTLQELALLAANNPRDVLARVLLARLVYQQNQDAKRALRYLSEAAAAAPHSTTVAWLRSSILQTESRPEEARGVLDTLVKTSRTFGAYQLRASFLAEAGELKAAEKDYVHLTTLQPRSNGYQLLASFYHATNRLDRAVITQEEGLKVAGDDAVLQFGLVTFLIQRNARGDLPRAGKLLSTLEEQFGESPNVLFARAAHLVTQRDKGFLAKARAVLEKLVKLEPAQIRGYLALIRIAMSDGDSERARAVAIRGLEACPNHTQMLLAKARAESALKDDSAAFKTARKILRRTAGNTEAIEILASAAMKLKNPAALSEALTLSRRAVRTQPAAHRLALAASTILRAMGKPADAVAELEAYAKSPAGQRSIPVLVALAHAHRRMGNLDASEEWIDRAEKLAPDSIAVLRARLRLLAARKDFEQICSRMTKYCDRDQPAPSVLTLAASLLADTGATSHLQAAVKFCRRAVAVSPDPMNERLALAAVLLLTGDIDGAEALYRQVHKGDPDNVRALNGLAWTLGVHRKDYKAALPLIDQASRLAPNNSDVRDTRGTILSNLPGRMGDARGDFEKCVTLSTPDSRRHAKALFHLGLTCHKLTDHAAARKHLTEALRIDAKNKALTNEQRRRIAEILNRRPAKSGS